MTRKKSTKGAYILIILAIAFVGFLTVSGSLSIEMLTPGLAKEVTTFDHQGEAIQLNTLTYTLTIDPTKLKTIELVLRPKTSDPAANAGLYINNVKIIDEFPLEFQSSIPGESGTPIVVYVKLSRSDDVCTPYEPYSGAHPPNAYECIVDPGKLDSILNNMISNKINVKLVSDKNVFFNANEEEMRLWNAAFFYSVEPNCPTGQIPYQDQCVTPDIISPSMHFRQYDCPISSGYMSMLETFQSGDIIGAGSFARSPNYFCEMMPMVRLNSQGGFIDNSLSQYKSIVNGETLTVPDGELWLFAYVTNDLAGLPVSCSTEELYSNGECIPNPGIVYACTGGQFSYADGVCVVDSGSATICTDGGVYYVDGQYAGQCVKFITTIDELNKTIITKEFYTPENVPICEKGSYNKMTDKCEYASPSMFEGGYEGETSYVAQAGRTIGGTTGIVILMFAAVIIAWYIGVYRKQSKGRRRK